MKISPALDCFAFTDCAAIFGVPHSNPPAADKSQAGAPDKEKSQSKNKTIKLKSV